MKRDCPSCKVKSELTLLKKAKSLLIGNQYKCSNCQAVLAWDRFSHFLTFLLPILLITPSLLANFIELPSQHTIYLFICFGLISLLLLIIGFYRRYLVVYKR